MSLDDLLGLLFLLFFVLIPALQGLLRRPPTPQDLPLPEAPEAPPQAPVRPRPKAQRPPKPPPAKEPPKREPRLEAPPQAAFSGLESRLMSSGLEEEAAKPKRKKPKLVRTEGNEILKGVIWHEILKKPRGW
jgi:hypothetical protein